MNAKIKSLGEPVVAASTDTRSGVGWSGTAELLLTGRLPRKRRCRSVFVDRVVEGDPVLAEATRLVEEVLSCAPVAVRLTWEAMHRGLDLSLDASAALGADAFGLVASTEDFRRRVGA